MNNATKQYREHVIEWNGEELKAGYLFTAGKQAATDRHGYAVECDTPDEIEMVSLEDMDGIDVTGNFGRFELDDIEDYLKEIVL